MKKYRPMYGATLLVFMEKMFIGTLPIIFILAYVISKAERYSFWELIILILTFIVDIFSSGQTERFIPIIRRKT